ncbi:MAG: HipA domain-containing protein [Magnetococcales bacterium]|nr:HipA domain-containing protein [Magnetococcales bacterium]
MNDSPPPLDDEPEIDLSKPITLQINRADRQGIITPVGSFHIDFPRKRFILELNSPILGLYEAGIHELDHLPPYIEDVRPQGFIGRLFADALGLPTNPKMWTDAQVVRSFIDSRFNHPGNLFFSTRSTILPSFVYSLVHPYHTGDEIISFNNIISSLSYVTANSSAGGDQPKFLGHRWPLPRKDLPSEFSEQIIKYSPLLYSGPLAQRWHDLLRVEHLCLTISHQFGLPAASTRLIESADRIFLEVTRFDRLPMTMYRPTCRIGMVSFWCVAVTLWGEADLDRLEVGERLHREGRLPLDDLETLRTRVALDALLANTDTHLWNYSLLEDEAGVWRLSPSYDLLPMALSPHGAELFDRPPPPRRSRFLAELRERLGEDHWSRGEAIAKEIWNRAREDANITSGFLDAWRLWLPFA